MSEVLQRNVRLWHDKCRKLKSGLADGRVFADECSGAEGMVVNHAFALGGLLCFGVGQDVDVRFDVFDIWTSDLVIQLTIPVAMFGGFEFATFAMMILARYVLEAVTVTDASRVDGSGPLSHKLIGSEISELRLLGQVSFVAVVVGVVADGTSWR